MIQECEKWVKCVSNDDFDYEDLTVGKVYKAFKEDEIEYKIVDDGNIEYWYLKEFFEVIDSPDVDGLQIQAGDEVRAFNDHQQELLYQGLELLLEENFKSLDEVVKDRDLETIKGVVSDLETIADLMQMFE